MLFRDLFRRLFLRELENAFGAGKLRFFGTGTALPINLSYRECRSFQQRWRLTQSRHTALNRRPRSQTNRLPPGRQPSPDRDRHGLRPLSP